jgi:hypothetical protein
VLAVAAGLALLLAPAARAVDAAPVAGAGHAIAFDGTTQDARVEDPTSALSSAWSIELWFDAGTATSAGDACLVQQGEGLGLRFGLCLSAARDALLIRRGFETTSIPVALDAGWHHLTLAAGDVDTLVYLDDRVFSPLLGLLQAGAGQPLVIGGAPLGAGATDRFEGAIDELRLWATTRSAEEIDADARRPVPADAPGLLALWRMDLAAGTTLLDAGPAHLDAALTAPGAGSLIPSGAWTRRVLPASRVLAPFLDGYDPDGDPFTLTVVVPPAHGRAEVVAGSVGYLPDALFSGLDRFTCQVSSRGLTSRYTTEVLVPAPVSCQADAECGAGERCVDRACVSTRTMSLAAGRQGCSSAGAGGPVALLALLLLLPWRRARATAPATGRRP